MRSILRSLAGITLIIGAFWNLWSFGAGVSRLPPRESEGMVIWENRFNEIRNELIRQKYRAGKVDFVTARSLKGESQTDSDGLHWSALRYVAIPLLLVRDDNTAPYVLADFTDGTKVPDTLEGFTRLAGSGDGLILYKRNLPQ